MQLVGPLPRDTFSAAAFDGRTAAVDGALQATDAPVAEDDCAREGEKLWGAGNPSRRAEKIERECGAHGAEAVHYTNVCRLFALRIGTRLRVGFWAPARVSRGYGVPLAFLKSSRSRVPRTHTRTHAGGGGPSAGAAEKIGRGSRGAAAANGTACKALRVAGEPGVASRGGA
ncbi:retrotransposon hot spot (RHS) protein [Trypanosoma conorhini]|uniref:Retrotransposon hot spot (RHS) protein n=1 Tax=Trypanosoma conorhini TaxID=83891 RepID=A0A3R7JYG2_9TRYP|nr:retrotransposon hot spot (RHS) protein [Trypanosoma conorhini]RNE98875.1 retrotransposon hot spot (RHS) protein [Trypanosoma conorhini]